MSLDLDRMAAQVEEMASHLNADNTERQKHLAQALSTLSDKSINIEQIKEKIAAGKISWLVAEPCEALSSRYTPTITPPDFTVIAADGSQIDIDRHHSIRYFLINIGSVYLHYGENPDAQLSSLPKLYFDKADLVMTSPEDGNREIPVEGNLLGIKRDIEEFRHLAQMAASLATEHPALLLSDGTLIRWNLMSKDIPEFIVEEFLEKGFLRCLDDIKKLSQNQKIALASYISFPRSTDVVGTIRIAICPHEPPNCDRCRKNNRPGEYECNSVDGVQDKDIFQILLDNGERSALFISRSSIQERYGVHRVYFYYVKMDGEIARIEVPEWVARDKELLNLTHTLLLDQCQKGQGYPVALCEAHEQAVVTFTDRESLQTLVELSLGEKDMPLNRSAKSMSKKTRWI
ncbi:MAG: DNA double-strand break repair nuclease NurA [Dehalococcoidales bacterium]|nr:DNA double-strand break repair nuclease NurA [Dehalococcoidales bacterium]